jgi:hypothetical protein
MIGGNRLGMSMIYEPPDFYHDHELINIWRYEIFAKSHINPCGRGVYLSVYNNYLFARGQTFG